MGADLATSCSLINGKIELYTYITRGGPDYGANRNGVVSTPLRVYMTFNC